MKKFEYGYFALYQMVSRQHYFPNAATVRMKSMYLLSLSVAGWILFLQQVVLRFIRWAWFSSPEMAMINALSVYLGITFIFYHVMILQEKDQQIYDKYLDRWNRNPNQKRDLGITLALAALPYVAMVGIKLWLHK